MKNLDKHNDSELAGMLWAKSPKCDHAFNTLFERYGAKLNAFCIFKSKNRADAEELFEDTWLKFLDRAKSGKQIDNALPYLYSIARTLAIDKYRRDNAKRKVKIEFFDSTDIDFNYPSELKTDSIEDDEIFDLVMAAASTLDDIYREAFVLKWFGGLDNSEIAEITGATVAAVKMRVGRAMERIIKIIKPKFKDAF
jgi:RNA polymerase sigma-70 factor (ECF subfamily)